MVWQEKSFNFVRLCHALLHTSNGCPSWSEKNPLTLVLPHPLPQCLCSCWHALLPDTHGLYPQHLQAFAQISPPQIGLPYDLKELTLSLSIPISSELFFSVLIPYLIFKNLFTICLPSQEHSSMRIQFCSLLSQHLEQWLAHTKCSINHFWMIEWNEYSALRQQMLLIDAEKTLNKQQILKQTK